MEKGRVKLEPHEVAHLLGRRMFVFLDEWCTYGMMLYLYNYHSELFWAMLPIAILMNYDGYIGLWELRNTYGLEKHHPGALSSMINGLYSYCTTCLLDAFPVGVS